jgi:hypothetical protein
VVTKFLITALLQLSVATPQIDAFPLGGGVLRRHLEIDRTYALNISPQATVLLHFPVACHTAFADPQSVGVQIQSEHPEDVLLVAHPHAALGSLSKINLLCAQDVRVSLALQVTEPQRVSPRVEFYYDAGTVSLIHSAVQAERRRLHALAVQAQQLAQQDQLQLALQTTLWRAQQAFTQTPLQRSARVGGSIVHVDAHRQLGELHLLEFRVQNLQRTDMRLHSVRLQPRGCTAAAVEACVAPEGCPPPAPAPGPEPAIGPVSGSNSAAAPSSGSTTAPDPAVTAASLALAPSAQPQPLCAALCPQTRLHPGETVRCSVAAAWPSDVQALDLAVTLRAPADGQVTVHNLQL